jgi:hypothetical protein
VVRLDKSFDLWFRPFHGYYCRAVYDDDVPRRLLLLVPLPECLMKKKSVGKPAAGGSGAVHLAPIESNTFTALPNLMAHLCLVRYDDGDARQPGTLSVRTLGSSWAVTVKDPDGACQMQCLGNTLDDALALVDLLLGSEEAPWEADRWAKKPGKGAK